MKKIINFPTKKILGSQEYYDNYIGTMEIFQLNGAGEITYGIKAIEVYPTTIAGIEYAYASANTIALQSVNFQYRQWFNMTSDDIAGYKTRINDEWAIAESQLKTIRAVEDKLASNTSAKREQSKQRFLRKPEVDTGTTNLAARNAIARGLGYESAAALKTALRNKAKGL